MKINFGRVAGCALLAGSVLLSGCDVDNLLDVEDPDTVNPGTLQDPELLQVVVNGAISEFVSGYSGAGGDAYVSVSAVMSDEFVNTGTFPTRTRTDRRDQFAIADGNTSDGPYINLQQARRAAKDAAELVAEFEGTSDPRYGEMKSLEGYTYIALGEGYCNFVPFSNVAEGGGFEYGEPQGSGQTLEDAIVRFDAAISGSGSDLARIGKGRALLSLERYQEAAAAVASVPTTFVYATAHSESGANNPIYVLQQSGRYAQTEMEGGNGLPFRSADDPRAPWWVDPVNPTAFIASLTLYTTRKFDSRFSPLAIATGVEARLIEAEAALQAGAPGDMITILNDLRAQVQTLMPLIAPPTASLSLSSLPPLTDPGTPAARVDLLFRERAFWMYLSGHRLGDLRRLVANYGRDQADVYPTGEYFKGGDYGSDVVFPIDFDESNNPNISDFSGCVETDASFN